MSQPAEAASVLLARGPGSSEVFVVRRAASLRFFGSFYAFPGGKVIPADAVTVERLLPQTTGAVSPLDIRRVTAARELFEETGVLIARRADGSFPSGPDLAEQRQALLADQASFADILQGLDLFLSRFHFISAGTLVTPPFTALRFDTAFFVAVLPPGQEAEVWPGELDEGHWTSAEDLLQRWTQGDYLVSPPTLALLEAVRGRPIADLPERIEPLVRSHESGAIPPIFFAPGVQQIPLQTTGLAPSTYTNAFLIGRDALYLLDPGPSDPAEQQRLFDVLDAHQAEGRRLRAVVLTHHHPDHVGAVAACVQRYRVPVWAHPWTAQALHDRCQIDRLLTEGDRLDLGRAPDGSGPWYLETLHTPGHAPGHLAFYEPHYRLLFVGDLVSTLSSVVIAPPDGDLAVYLASLRRVRSYDCRLLLPGHGSVSARPQEVLDEALAHRARREEQLLAALGEQPRTIAELVPELYRGLPENLTRLAALQMLAGLLKLQREGRVLAAAAGSEQGWRLP